MRKFIKINIMALLSLFILSSCNDEEELLIESSSVDEELLTTETPQDDTYVIANVKGAFYTIARDVGDGYYAYSDDQLIHQNDILSMEVIDEKNSNDLDERIDILNSELQKSESIESRGRHRNPKLTSLIENGADLWYNSLVVFQIDPRFDNNKKAQIYKAISEWAKKTNLTFIIRAWTVSSIGVIEIEKTNSGCSSTVGSPGSSSGNMRISQTCDVQSITHEIGHAVGLVHEHQRPKRDGYITVPSNLYTNITNQFGASLSNIVKDNLKKVVVYSDASLYDTHSVMHYGSWPRNHIELRDYLMSINVPIFRNKSNGNDIPRPESGLTDIDVQKINQAYPNVYVAN